jgi:hypothetical protein
MLIINAFYSPARAGLGDKWVLGTLLYIGRFFGGGWDEGNFVDLLDEKQREFVLYMASKDIIIGIVCIILGSLFLYKVIRYPNKAKYDPFVSNLQGFFAGILFIIIGILTLIGYFKKW